MKGWRVDISEDPIELKPGEYGLYKGHWWVYPPKEDAGPIDVSKWTVTEYLEDKTISVRPSINVMGIAKWHGFLTKGEWSEC